MGFTKIYILIAIATIALAHPPLDHHPHQASSYSLINIQEEKGHHDHGHDWSHDDHHHNQHPKKYNYDYGVKDPHTGDNKDVWEKSDGDVVRGGYTIHEADGRKRIVEYTSDKKHGFHAKVKTSEHQDHHHKW